jgi:DNA polymerase V
MIALIDCNNFYVSCERVFQPALIGRALIVLSNNDGCAIARSEEAKALGVKMAQPVHLINDLIEQNNIAVYSSNYTLYDNMSKRVMDVIKSFVPRTEVYSIDEIFADLSGIQKDYLPELAQKIRENVMSNTGIPVSVGIAPTKALAKMANRYAKKTRPDEGVFVAGTQELIDMMLRFTEVGDIWGIGKQLETLLRTKGFNTAYEFVCKAPEEWIRKEMTVVGQRLYNELKGISCIKWDEERPTRKNICTSRSFGNLITTKSEIRHAIAKFTSSCAEKLRKEYTCAKKVNVFIKTNPHRPTDKQYEQSITLELQVASNLTTELMKYSMKALDMIFQSGYNYQKAGVIVLDLISEKQVQLGLFDNKNRSKDKRLMESVDKVNRIFGKDSVRYGVQGYSKKWHLKQGNLSLQYTTNLSHIPKAS